MKRSQTKRRKHTARRVRPVKGMPNPVRKRASRTRKGW
jgi:hypothetical protein